MKQVPCTYCGKMVYTEHAGSFEQVTGWVVRRGQGGANAITMREPTGRWAHTVCVDKAKRGISSDQAEMEI